MKIRRRAALASGSVIAIVAVLAVVAASGYGLYFSSEFNSKTITITSISLSTVMSTVNSTTTVISRIIQGEGGTTTQTSTTLTSSASTSSTGSIFQGVLVIIPDGVSSNESLDFTPSTIKVVIGVNNTVTWLNQDTSQHTVTYQSIPKAVQYIEALLKSGQTFTTTLTVPGTYRYNCMWHPGWMKGTIVVKP